MDHIDPERDWRAIERNARSHWFNSIMGEWCPAKQILPERKNAGHCSCSSCFSDRQSSFRLLRFGNGQIYSFAFRDRQYGISQWEFCRKKLRRRCERIFGSHSPGILSGRRKRPPVINEHRQDIHLIFCKPQGSPRHSFSRSDLVLIPCPTLPGLESTGATAAFKIAVHLSAYAENYACLRKHTPVYRHGLCPWMEPPRGSQAKAL